MGGHPEFFCGDAAARPANRLRLTTASRRNAASVERAMRCGDVMQPIEFKDDRLHVPGEAISVNLKAGSAMAP